MSREVHIIVAIHVTNRVERAGELQQLLSDYGCYIKTRIGLHEASDNFCSANGVIILEMLGNEPKAEEMVSALKKFVGVDVEKIVFKHPSENMSSAT